MALELAVLLPNTRHQRLATGATDSYHAMTRQQECNFDVRRLFTCPDQIDLERNTATALVAEESGWLEVRLDSLPTMIHNCIVHPTTAEARTLRALNGDIQTALFNESNRWDRRMLFAMLQAVPAVAEVVPQALPLTHIRLAGLKPGTYLIGPSRRPLRQEAVLLTVEADHIRYRRIRDGTTGRASRSDLWAGLPGWVPSHANWIASLPGEPTGPDGPAEWRVYVLRTESGDWRVAGAVAKHDSLRAGSRRERCWALERGLSLTLGADGSAVADRVLSYATKVVEAFALFVPGVAHCAVDFWTDAEGRIVLADLVGGFRTDWLRRIGDSEAIQALAEHPLRFARALARTGGGKLHVDFGRSLERPDPRNPPPLRLVGGGAG